MSNIHTTNILPNQKTINSLAALSATFKAKQSDTTALLTHLKETILETKFMDTHDDPIWMATCGCDFIANPKLFAVAPLTYICVFLGELFNNLEIDEIQERVSFQVIEQALLRLTAFKMNEIN
ncbi:hypothetical protein [Psychromonas antarctica]|uniref:hypothetical protein n=1 Tax=Psychromonas antarctica TaxID=67573 RepID=UPI001EE8227B|nr:hypothetical protein [Psychromonas antarctica]MCG6200920.1 hypothetical protein [Psychromonas antarctica]